MEEKQTSSDVATIERRMRIVDKLNAEGRVMVSQLSKLFSVSEVTIRNDLQHLENKGLLIKTRGGGLRPPRAGIDFKLNEKAKLHSAEKQRIGKKAADMIMDNDTIIIDSGTTTLEIAKHLHDKKGLTVIANALNIASELANYESLKVILLGGFLRNTSLSLTGSISENIIRNFYSDKLFIGVDGIEAERGIYTPNPEEASLNRCMIDNAKQVIVVADSSKFKRRSFAFIAPINKIDVIVTDSGIPEEELHNLTNQGIEVIIT